nr:facilitated trehalose transporter Tret1-2 homolog [Onthophagus taurus]XP_022901995.1 facilitated trehalose transporter Tret1-2 homolog [Onthophagus taurus]
MDISASAFNLQNEEKAIAKERKQDEQFNLIITSCTSLSRYESKRFKTLLPQILAALISSSYHIVYGISLAFSAVLIPVLEETEGDLNIEKNGTTGGFIASIIVIVVPIASIVCGFIMDYLGRLHTLKLTTIPVTIGWALIATAQNIPMVLVGRLLTGLAGSFGTSPAIVYITEIARADMRGSLISSAPAFTSLGMVLAYLMGWFMTWRQVSWVCTALSIIPCFLVLLIPESPVWLVSKGRLEQARKSLEWIHKYHPKPQDRMQTMAELHLAVLVKDDRKKKEEAPAIRSKVQIFKDLMKPTAYKPLILLLGLFCFQQFSGIYITLFYAIHFFKKVDQNLNPYLASIFLGTVRFVMSLANTYMLRRFQRRPLVLVSCVGMAICMFISGMYTLHGKNDGTNSFLKWVPVILLVIYVITSMIGLLPIPWTMSAELFPLEIRGVAQSLSYSIANTLMFAAIQSYYPLERLFGGAAGVQFFFGVMALAGLVYSFVFQPETHGKKLTDIVEYFNENTIYLLAKKKEKKGKEKKPIVKNRAAKTDVEKADDKGQSKNLMEEGN